MAPNIYNTEEFKVMPDDEIQAEDTGGNTTDENRGNRRDNRQQQPNRPKNTPQPVVKLMLDGPFNKCELSVDAKPGQRVEFYVGNQGRNTLRRQLVDAGNNPFVVNTNHLGLVTINNLDFTQFEESLKDMDCITAITSDTKRSTPQPLPPKPVGLASQGRFLKIISPDAERYVRHDRNEYSIDLITFTEPKVPGTRRVVLNADGAITVLDGAGNVLVDNVTRWEFDTNPDGTHHHVVKPIGYTKREVKYNIAGDTQIVCRTLEFL